MDTSAQRLIRLSDDHFVRMFGVSRRTYFRVYDAVGSLTRTAAEPVRCLIGLFTYGGVGYILVPDGGPVLLYAR